MPHIQKHTVYASAQSTLYTDCTVFTVLFQNLKDYWTHHVYHKVSVFRRTRHARWTQSIVCVRRVIMHRMDNVVSKSNAAFVTAGETICV